MARRTAQDAERAARIVELRTARRSFRQIGAELGLSHQRVQKIYERALAQAPNAAVDVMRAEEGELLDTAVRSLMLIALDRANLPRDRVEAWNAVVKVSERRSKLFGLDAPAKLEVHSLDQLDVEIRQLTAKLRGAEAAEALDDPAAAFRA